MAGDSETQDLLRVGPPEDPDRYVLEEPIGRPGGEGQVWKAYPEDDLDPANLLPRRYLAIKQLVAPHRTPDRRAALGQRWLQSADFMKAIRATGLAHVAGGFDGGEPHRPGEPPSGKTWYLVMEWVPGVTYEHYLKHHHGDIRPLGEAALGLDSLHSSGYVHGDVKPLNLKIVETEHREASSKLVDLGLIREITGEPASWIVRSTSYTDPAILRGYPYNEFSDLYSFAATLYRGLVGAPPNQKNYPAAVKRLQALSEGPGIDRIAAALDPDPDLRAARAGYETKALDRWFVEVVKGVASIPADQRHDAVRTVTMGGTSFALEHADAEIISERTAGDAFERVFRWVLNTRNFVALIGLAVILGMSVGRILV
jgi:eukaryotic-like serine/threonine-protein kinase